MVIFRCCGGCDCHVARKWLSKFKKGETAVYGITENIHRFTVVVLNIKGGRVKGQMLTTQIGLELILYNTVLDT